MRAFLWILVFNLCSTYGQSGDEVIPLSFEKDLIPEGIAIHEKTGKIYLNSLTKSKIVRCDINGDHPEEFISSEKYGYLPGFGMTIKGDTLYALGNTLEKSNNKSILLLLNVTSGELFKSYPLNLSQFIYLNDIAISSKGKVFITDSESNTIYTINRATQKLEPFFSHDDIKHPNGISISAEDDFLYVASYASGIRIVDIATKTLANRPNTYKGIDGMKQYNNTLIAMVNGSRDKERNGLYRFHLHATESEILEEEKLYHFANPTDIPTTFALSNGRVYFLADSQMDMLDQTTNEIKNRSNLEDYRLIIKKL